MAGILQTRLCVPSSSGITFIAAGTAGTGNNPTAVLPAGHTSGDLLVIVGASGGIFSDPAGWTIGVNNTSNSRLCIWYKIDSGAESNVTVTNAATTSQVVMLAFRGVNATPLDVNGTTNSPGSTSIPTNSLTTTVANDLILSCYGSGTNADTLTTPAGTSLAYNGGGVANTRALLAAYEIQAASGATTSRTSTSGGGTTTQSHAISFKP